MADFVPPVHNSASPFADMRGRHVAVRTADLETAKRWYVETLDFRVVAEWDYADEKLAYVAPPTDDHFYVEILGGGDPGPRDVRPYSDLGDSLKYAGYHHFCLNVSSVDETARARRDDRRRAVRAARHQPPPRLLLRPLRQPDRACRSAGLTILRGSSESVPRPHSGRVPDCHDGPAAQVNRDVPS